jgi:polyketide synthase-associated protein
LARDVLTEVQQLPGGRFQPPPASESAKVADGLLGQEGTARVAELKTPDDTNFDGDQLRELDQFVAQLSFGLNDYLPAIGTDASSRTMGLLLETVVQEEGTTNPTQDMTEVECGKWLRIFTLHRVMILFFLGPAKGTLELGLLGEDETEAGERQKVSTGPGVMVVLRPDVVSRRHSVESGRSLAFACFSCTTRERPGPSEPPLAPYRDDLMMWIMDRLKDLKNKEQEDPMALETVPKEWVRAMNAEFAMGQQACIRSDACKMPGPLSFDPYGFNMEINTGPDFIIEVPYYRFDIDNWYYSDPKDPGWMEYKTYCRHGAFIDGGELWDNKQFGISANEAVVWSPTATWALEVGYEAITAAGWTKKSLHRLKADVHYGLHFLDNNLMTKTEPAFHFGGGGSQAGEANKVSFCLNIMGQSLTLDTDGSSSLAALWHAHLDVMDEAPDRRSPAFALVLGFCCNISPSLFANFCFRKLLSDKHRCMSFDQSTNGLIRSEGIAGIVLTELYKQKEKQDEPVIESTGLGTVRSAGMMQCGKGATLTTPNGICMQETMAWACRQSHLQCDDLDVLECHSPGFQIHDAAEVVAISKIFRTSSNDLALPLTTLKTAIGDGYAAAGIFSVIRVIHSTLNANIPPNLHLNIVNANLREHIKKPLIISAEPIMQQSSATGLAGINSFGNGGSYITAVLWGNVGEAVREREAEEPVGLKGPKVVFWPGGGGGVGEEGLPKDGD